MLETITLVNPETKEEKEVKVNANLNAWTLFTLEKEGIINKTFLGTLLVAGGGSQNLDLLDAFRVVYASYRQANQSDFLNFESFMKQYEINVSEAFEIFGAVLGKEKQKNKMAQGFQDKAKKKA
ncbi:hypothetical protein CN895_23095 [Bacillus cereus]|uniref:hypothetical protein n=1 Tax=Bacillus cereus group TaxID=86661 RepID=UPI000BFD91B8|nr:MULTISPECIES: hypothetical protein [Bacillus cereus group]PGK10539.1 hypothetical protein CN895_23095 [Bacillus cereus]PGW24554.1 hypothetical protein COD95_09345 [Bacillus thuringiensis]